MFLKMFTANGKIATADEIGREAAEAYKIITGADYPLQEIN